VGIVLHYNVRPASEVPLVMQVRRKAFHIGTTCIKPSTVGPGIASLSALSILLVCCARPILGTGEDIKEALIVDPLGSSAYSATLIIT
jgi:hypothetical protein